MNCSREGFVRSVISILKTLLYDSFIFFKIYANKPLNKCNKVGHDRSLLENKQIE